jgi:hypothetical protein
MLVRHQEDLLVTPTFNEGAERRCRYYYRWRFFATQQIAKLAIPAYHSRPSAPPTTLHEALDINVLS